MLTSFGGHPATVAAAGEKVDGGGGGSQDDSDRDAVHCAKPLAGMLM